MLTAQMVEELVAAGLSGEALVSACKRIENNAPQLVKSRISNVTRQAKFRAKKAENNVTGNVTEVECNVTKPPIPPLEDSSQEKNKSLSQSADHNVRASEALKRKRLLNEREVEFLSGILLRGAITDRQLGFLEQIEAKVKGKPEDMAPKAQVNVQCTDDLWNACQSELKDRGQRPVNPINGGWWFDADLVSAAKRRLNGHGVAA